MNDTIKKLVHRFFPYRSWSPEKSCVIYNGHVLIVNCNIGGCCVRSISESSGRRSVVRAYSKDSI